jgi:hypothetical protein
MTEAEIIGLLVSLSCLVTAVLAIWWRIEARIRSAEAAVMLKAESASAQAHANAVQIAEARTHVAETYMTKSGLKEFRDEVMTSMRELKGSISTLHERIDQIILIDRRKRPPASG